MRYDRSLAVAYAQRQVFTTEEDYCSGTDGDATAFVSRCIGEGLQYPLNHCDADDLIAHLKRLSLVRKCPPAELEAGDIIQIRSRHNTPYKSMLVTARNDDELLVAAHSYASYNRPVTSYLCDEIQCFKILK